LGLILNVIGRNDLKPFSPALLLHVAIYARAEEDLLTGQWKWMIIFRLA
jgi:hypothetical protein